MTIYLVLWFAAYCMLGAVAVRALPHRLATMTLILAFGFFAIVRGSVGTDTAGVYEPMARDLLSNGFGANTVEPAFRALLFGFTVWTASPQLAVRGIAFAFTAILLGLAMRANKVESWYLLALFIPAFFIQLSFNAERIGLALAGLLLSLHTYRLGRSRRSIALLWGSALFHYSSVVIPAYTLLVESGMRTKRFVLTATIALCAVTAFAYAAQVYVLQKYTLYALSGFDAPGPLSGLSQIAIVVVILVGLRYFHLEKQLQRRTLWVTIVLCVIFWVVTRYSYVGLRLLDLLAFALPYSLMRAIARGDGVLTNRAKGVFVVAGFVGTVFFFRNMLVEPMASVSPFIPYRFLWQ